MATSSWLVGSIRGFADQTVNRGATPVAMTFSYDGTYLDHATAGLSMLETLEDGLNAVAVGHTVYLRQDGYVQIDGPGTFALTWTSSGTDLRDALGFTGDLSAASSYTAPNRSELLWVPRRNEDPRDAPLGVSGAPAYAVDQRTSRDGTQVTRVFGDPVRRNQFTWRFIDAAQYWTSAEAAGELVDFLEEVGIPGEKFFVYRQVDATYTSSSSASLGTGLGPYELTNGTRSLQLVRAQGFESTDCKFDWTAEVLVTPEYAS